MQRTAKLQSVVERITETLPKDGADYHCQYRSPGTAGQCRKITTIGLTMDAWKRLDSRFFAMRAICAEHATHAAIILHETGWYRMEEDR